MHEIDGTKKEAKNGIAVHRAARWFMRSTYEKKKETWLTEGSTSTEWIKLAFESTLASSGLT